MDKSNLFRKHAARFVGNLNRLLVRQEGQDRPGVLLNSLPKSGTHLLQPMLLSAGLVDYQGFFASTPPLTMRRRSDHLACRALPKIMPNELFSGHIFFAKQLEEIIKEARIPSIFIYRDPRAVFLSELNYVHEMNRWHRYHKFVKRAGTREAAFDLLLQGMPDADFFFPPFAERVRPYIGWLNSEGTFSLRFEDLIGPSAHFSVARLLEYLSSFHNDYEDLVSDAELPSRMLGHVGSDSSHTFTGQDPNRWKSVLSGGEIEALDFELAEIVECMGYK